MKQTRCGNGAVQLNEISSQPWKEMLIANWRALQDWRSEQEMDGILV